MPGVRSKRTPLASRALASCDIQRGIQLVLFFTAGSVWNRGGRQSTKRQFAWGIVRVLPEELPRAHRYYYCSEVALCLTGWTLKGDESQSLISLKVNLSCRSGVPTMIRFPSRHAHTRSSSGAGAHCRSRMHAPDWSAAEIALRRRISAGASGDAPLSSSKAFWRLRTAVVLAASRRPCRPSPRTAHKSAAPDRNRSCPHHARTQRRSKSAANQPPGAQLHS
jgi:hypothetical protein